jgi:nucleotide-binding universal stress UspA family protein
MISIRLILCPVDFSETSQHALRYALELGRGMGAKVHLVHVYQLPMYAMPDGALIAPPEQVASLSDKLQQELNKMATAFPGVTKTHLLEGVAHHEIERLATEIGADMIVMGTHGRSGLARVLIGSVAERVVRHSQVPVLTVHRPEEAK